MFCGQRGAGEQGLVPVWCCPSSSAGSGHAGDTRASSEEQCLQSCLALFISRGSRSPEVPLEIVSSVRVGSVESLRTNSVTISCLRAQALLF